MTIGLFYLMLSPLPDRYSLDWRLRKLQPKDPQLLGFWRRVLQLHLMHRLFFQRPNEMSRPRLVEWLECVARSHPPAFQRHRSRDTRKMEVPVPSRRNLYLSLGNRISIFYLEQQDEKDLVHRHVCDARRDRVTMGMYLFAFVMIILNVAAFGPGLFARSETNPFTACSESLNLGP